MERYQTSMELLQDLKEALKNPNGDFVEDNYDATARTQKYHLMIMRICEEKKLTKIKRMKISL